MVVKKPVKKVTEKVTKEQPSVTVETKKISNSDSCCSPNCRLWKHFFMILLLIANTVLLALVLANQTRMESMKAGGKDNYWLLKQVFQTEWYKAQQRQQLEQALQVLSQPQAQPALDWIQAQPEVEQPQEL